MRVEETNEKLWFLCKIFQYHGFKDDQFKEENSLGYIAIRYNIRYVNIINTKDQSFREIFFQEKPEYEMKQFRGSILNISKDCQIYFSYYL